MLRFSSIPSVITLSALIFALGCDSGRCSINSQCGTESLCRAGVCLPRCVTYKTCQEGEACVNGACDIPSADFCSDIVPSMMSEEGATQFPVCPPTLIGGGTEAMSVGGASAGGQAMDANGQTMNASGDMSMVEQNPANSGGAQVQLQGGIEGGATP